MTKGAPRSHPLPATSAPAALAAELPPIGSVDLADAAANRPVPAANRQAAEWPSPGRAPLLAVLGDEPADTIAGLNQRNAPCRRRAFARAARTVQVPPANRAAEYRLHTAQSVSLCDIGRYVRISGTTGELSRRDIRGALEGNNVPNSLVDFIYGVPGVPPVRRGWAVHPPFPPGARPFLIFHWLAQKIARTVGLP
jgi:hypothetical protein